MNILQLFVAASATLFIFGGGVASAGEPKKDTGAMACVNDKWDVRSLRKDTSSSTPPCAVSSSPMISPNRRSAKTARETTNICLTAVGRVPEPARTIIPREDISNLGRGLAAQGVHVHQNRRHREIPGRHGWRHVHVPEFFRHALRWPI